MTKTAQVVPLADMQDGQDADTFVLLAGKEELRTREGKPYFRVTFRDARRTVSFPIWGDAPLADDCRRHWAVGAFYKLRGTYRETSYGPQLDIRRIREVDDADRADGFNELDFLPQSRFDPRQMFAELRELAEREIAAAPLAALVLDLLDTHQAELLTLPAARRNHHAFAGGWLEHVLNVTRNVAWLAERYAELYPEMRPPLNRDLAIAGAILHDIGKLREIAWQPQGAVGTPEGQLLGHIIQGRDLLRESPAAAAVDEETRLRLEHIIVSHHRTPEWGSPKPPMTPEAFLVHAADDLDAKYQMLFAILADDASDAPLTSSRNVLGHAVFRGAT